MYIQDTDDSQQVLEMVSNLPIPALLPVALITVMPNVYHDCHGVQA